MESKQVLSILNEIESKFPIETWNVSGLDIWPYVRFRIGSKLFERKLIGSKSKKLLDRYLFGIFRYLLAFSRGAFRSSESEKCDFLFVENGTHVSKHNNLFYYIRTDPIREKLEKKGKKCKTYVTGYKFDSPSLFPNIHIQYSMDIQYFLSTIFQKSKSEDIEGYDMFIEFLKEKDIYDESFNKENILKGANRILFYRDFFKQRLLKLKPKAVFVLCYYSTYGYGLIKACKELGIPIIDIQHGLQGEYHYSYSGFKRVPEKGYNLLPDIFYVWGKEEKDTILKWKNNDIEVFEGGNDYLNLWKDSENDLVNSTLRAIDHKYSLNKYTKVILFTVYPGSGHDDAIVEAIQNSPKEWFWFVRHHPKSDSRSENMKERIGNVRCDFVIEDIVSIPLFALISLSDIHITERSSAVIECAEMGVPSIVTTKEAKDLFKTQSEQKMLLFTDTSEGIISGIRESKKAHIVKNRDESDINYLIEIIEKYAHHN